MPKDIKNYSSNSGSTNMQVNSTSISNMQLNTTSISNNAPQYNNSIQNTGNISHKIKDINQKSIKGDNNENQRNMEISTTENIKNGTEIKSYNQEQNQKQEFSPKEKNKDISPPSTYETENKDIEPPTESPNVQLEGKNLISDKNSSSAPTTENQILSPKSKQNDTNIHVNFPNPYNLSNTFVSQYNTNDIKTNTLPSKDINSLNQLPSSLNMNNNINKDNLKKDKEKSLSLSFSNEISKTKGLVKVNNEEMQKIPILDEKFVIEYSESESESDKEVYQNKSEDKMELLKKEIEEKQRRVNQLKKTKKIDNNQKISKKMENNYLKANLTKEEPMPKSSNNSKKVKKTKTKRKRNENTLSFNEEPPSKKRLTLQDLDVKKMILKKKERV